MAGISLQAETLTWWKVVISYLIDGIVLPMSFCITIITQPMWTSGDGVGDGMTGLLMPFLMLPFYFVICEYLFGKTLGKKLMGLTVVRKEKSK